MSVNKIILLGLPESGKTSFLAALSYYSDSSVETKNLRQYQLSSNTTYTTSLVQNWLKGQKQERTKIATSTSSDTIVELYLEEISTGEKFILHVPDYYGESFENQFNDRLIEIDYLNQIKQAEGMILFINPEKVKEATLIEDIQIANKIRDKINLNFPLETPEDPNALDKNEAIEPFNVEESPTQVVIVDLLEMNLFYLDKLPIRLSVVISAWDIILKDMPDLTPMKWIEKTLPLLYQFLVSNSERILFKVFGISALGGNIENEAELQDLMALPEPAKRIIVQEETNKNHNIASPIEWILNQWRKTTI